MLDTNSLDIVASYDIDYDCLIAINNNEISMLHGDKYLRVANLLTGKVEKEQGFIGGGNPVFQKYGLIGAANIQYNYKYQYYACNFYCNNNDNMIYLFTPLGSKIIGKLINHNFGRSCWFHFTSNGEYLIFYNNYKNITTVLDAKSLKFVFENPRYDYTDFDSVTKTFFSFTESSIYRWK